MEWMTGRETSEVSAVDRWWNGLSGDRWEVRVSEGRGEGNREPERSPPDHTTDHSGLLLLLLLLLGHTQVVPVMCRAHSQPRRMR